MEVIRFYGVPEDTTRIEYGLSNFTNLDVKISAKLGYFPWAEESLTFPNAEAAFQALKCHESQPDVKKFLECDNPRRVKGTESAQWAMIWTCEVRCGHRNNIVVVLVVLVVVVVVVILLSKIVGNHCFSGKSLS